MLLSDLVSHAWIYSWEKNYSAFVSAVQILDWQGTNKMLLLFLNYVFKLV